MNLVRESASEFIERKTREFREELAAGTGRSFKDIGRKGSHKYTREAWTFYPQTNLAEDKVFSFERLRWEGPIGQVHFGAGAAPGAIEYRIGYWIRRPNGRWVWGQFCPMIPKEDLEPLLKRAREEGTVP